MRRRPWIIMISLLLGMFGLWALMNSRTYQVFGTIVPRVETTQKVVALTFDDGPQPGFTDEIITILDEVDARATFFVTGAELEQHPAEAQRLVAAGHALGNHSYSHQRMILVSPSFVRREIEQTDRLIRSAGYTGRIDFRPPYGKKLVVLPFYLAQHDRTTIMVDVEPDSYDEIGQDAEKIADHVLTNARPGSIILLHVMNRSRRTSMAAVRPIVTRLKQQGYRFVTVPELLAIGEP